MSTRRYFDVLVVIPLQEELETFLEVFSAEEDLCTDTYFRFRVRSPGSGDLSILAIQQTSMGRKSAFEATDLAMNEYDIGLVVCLGIAGSLSQDMKLGCVCYTGEIWDVYDNAKATQDKRGKSTFKFSPDYYPTSQKITTALNFLRTVPDLKLLYVQWQDERFAVGRLLVPERVSSRHSGLNENWSQPEARDGAIVCAAVSDDPNYNEKLIQLDRKMLAIETESGGVFHAARRHNEVPALTIRGISDYADRGKGDLEESTAGNVRKAAAGNAASFLDLSFKSPFLLRFLEMRRLQFTAKENDPSEPVTSQSEVVQSVSQIVDSIDAQVRELSPEVRIQPQGYKLPLPRIRETRQTALDTPSDKVRPVEVYEVIQKEQRIVVSLSRTYPDNALPWIIARALVSSDVFGKQCIPVVVDGSRISPPRSGLIKSLAFELPESLQNPKFQTVFIVEHFPVGSITKLKFLSEECDRFPEAKFIFVLRESPNILAEAEFCRVTNSRPFEVCPTSFLEMSQFLQRTFSLSGSESEVVALRLKNIFTQYRLKAHPTYFAGLQRAVLEKLLQASRRAELIQLAVDGFLALLVATDRSDVSLGRIARTRFLRRVVRELVIKKRALSQSDVVGLASAMSVEHDYGIEAISFVNLFFEKGILHSDSDSVRFTLPFMEAYLLAVELQDDPETAKLYFSDVETPLQISVFDLYCELGPSQTVVDNVLSRLTQAVAGLPPQSAFGHTMLSEELNSVVNVGPAVLGNIAKKIRASTLAGGSSAEREEKQRQLDLADDLSELTQSKLQKNELSRLSGNTGDEIGASKSDEQIRIWKLGLMLLGSGAELLKAEIKTNIASKLLTICSVAIDQGFAESSKIDFQRLRLEIFESPEITTIRDKIEGQKKIAAFDGLVANLMSMLELGFLGAPLHALLSELCEQARLPVLATTISKLEVSDPFERLLRAVWLTDVNAIQGYEYLTKSLSGFGKLPLLRMTLSMHFLIRVHWSHGSAINRLKLIDAAERCGEPLKLRLDRSKLQDSEPVD